MIAAVQPKSSVWVVSTLAGVAEFFDVQPSTVKTDWRAAGMPGTPGHYDLREVRRWRDSRVDRRGDTASTTKASAEALLAFERHRKLKLNNDILAGQLIYADEASQRWNMGLLRIKHRLETAPAEMAMRFPEATRLENLAEFRDYIFGLLTEMSQWKPAEKSTLEVAAR